MNNFPLEKVLNAFRGRFGGEVTHDSESIGGREVYSFYLVSPAFREMGHLKRQDAAWEVIDGALSREEALQVSAILALAPGEIESLIS